MKIFNFFRNREQRSAGSSYTGRMVEARHHWIAGKGGLAELTSTVSSAVSLWEAALSLSAVEGTTLLDRQTMACAARSLALTGNAVFLIDGDRLVPVSSWDCSTRQGRPHAYKLTIPGESVEVTALAAEVVHVRIGADPAAPWRGVSPLRRSALTAGLLHEVETALSEVYSEAPLGSQIVPFPEAPGTDLDALGAGFRGRRGRVLLRESVNVAAQGGMAPNVDWKSQSVSPDLEKTMALQAMQGARHGILAAYGVLPALLDPNTTGPLVREAQRHLAQWTLQPIAMMIAEEVQRKTGGQVFIDTMRPLQAFDAGLRARAAATIIEALGVAKQAGVTSEEVQLALGRVNWADDNSDGHA